MVMAAQTEKRYVLGDYRLEAERRLLLRRDGQPVHLTNKPFQVLLYLIEHRDRVVSRNELLDHFWDGHDVYDVTLTKCVSTVRKALDDHLEQPRYIATHWAGGYRYIGPLEEQSLEPLPPAVEIERTRGVRVVVEEEDAQGTFPVDETVTPVLSPAGPGLLAGPARPSWRVPLVLAAVIIALIASALILYRHRAAESTPAPMRSIAVLPLKNLSEDPGNEYFSDGLTESLISALSRIEGLKVISRGSVYRYKGRDVDPREAGKQLGVAAILEGNLRQGGDTIRVAVRLVSAEDGRVLWANDTQDRALGDIFALQDEIARSVAAGLKIKLSGEGERRLAGRYTENLEAYQLYLKGRFFWNKRTIEGLRKSIEYYEHALEKDPGYALAYAGLADSYIVLGIYDEVPLKESHPKARAAAMKALEIDDTLAEAHTALAAVIADYYWDWSEAEREYRRAIELNPNYATGHQWFGEYAACMGRFDEALAEMRRAQEIDPLSLIINADLGMIFYWAHQPDQAIEQLQKTLEMDLNFGYAHSYLAHAYVQKGMYDEAVAEYLRAAADNGEGQNRVTALSEAYRVSGWRGFLQKQLDMMKEDAGKRYVTSFNMATVYARLDEKDQAFRWLQKAIEEHSSPALYLRADPRLDSLRSDPRFGDLLRRAGLP